MGLLGSLVRRMLHARGSPPARIRIVVTHYDNANYWRPGSELFLHIQAGRAGAAVDLGIAGDDTGQHISGKNRNFGELTTMYWAWKNLTDVEVIGFCHYRRYFLLDARQPGNLCLPHHVHEYLEPALTDTARLRRIGNCDVLVARPHHFERLTIESQYKAKHRPHDFDTMLQAVVERFPQYAESRQAFVDCRRLYCFNMFIARREFFQRYMQWLFAVVEDLERRIPVEADGYQRRTYAFLAERLLNWHLIHLSMTQRLRIHPLGVAFLDDLSYKPTLARY